MPINGLRFISKKIAQEVSSINDDRPLKRGLLVVRQKDRRILRGRQSRPEVSCIVVEVQEIVLFFSLTNLYYLFFRPSSCSFYL